MSGEEVAMVVTASVLMFTTSIFGIDLFITDNKDAPDNKNSYEYSPARKD